MSTNTFNDFAPDGTVSLFTFTFDLDVDESAVVVKVIPIGEESFVTKVEDTDYTLNRSVKTVQFIDGSGDPENLAAALLLRIERFTNRERVIDYQSGGTVRSDDANDDENRGEAVDQELETGLNNALTKNDLGDEFDAQGLPICNGVTGLDPDCFATREFVNGLIEGGDVFDPASGETHNFNGDGVTTEFILSGRAGTAAEAWFVTLDGVIQEADQSISAPVYTISQTGDSDYPSNGVGDDFLVFDVAPAVNVSIEARLIRGSFVGELGDQVVDTDNIADDAAGPGQLGGFGAGAADRFIGVDATGDVVAAETVEHAQISNFSAGVVAHRLDQLAAPTANIPMNSRKLTGMGVGSATTDSVTKGQTESLIKDQAQTTLDGVNASDFNGDVTGINQTHNFDSAGFRILKFDLNFNYTSTRGMSATAIFQRGNLSTDDVKHFVHRDPDFDSGEVIHFSLTRRGSSNGKQVRFKLLSAKPTTGFSSFSKMDWFAINAAAQ